ncbi:DUF2946 family protein [Xanthomonas oryzae pv. oryzicola]|uniref:DUF2946 family protein n=1 Tax=Xanthomonas oryzae TaxID=347 RepID=UPI0006437BB8|nr:DUF2946 family protein [Xanthomonas oryzae]AKK64022.1 hypothetical protein FE36_09360 [Xanthomonas oryzae pv. oryzicola]AKO00868.1 hypothetical protein ACU15_10515 [Xanthomonas oryzae pv. oryzicola]KOR45935.1 hypothetical protein ADT27_11935 [Xanthomonas oryzae]OLK87839.1 hypothetical protein BXOR1_14000 [Xanthomonas oryzae pv. oryzicola]QGH67950.1 hypothetical protein GHV42_11565 [Xanthomonas oryzae pv. oryzicola]
MLLVVVAPLISRALAHPMAVSAQVPVAHAGHRLDMQPATPQPADMQQMHHAMGHAMHHAMPMTMTMTMVPGPADAADADTRPSRSAGSHAEHDMGVDCEYCLIAARLISLLVALLLWLPIRPPVFRALAGLIATRRIPATGTLGARGPPLALAC